MNCTNVLEAFTCGICLETFDESSKSPRILSCGHSFCHTCLEKLLALSPRCPTCKAVILFQCIESIPINFSLKSLINIRNQFSPNISANLDLEGDITQISDLYAGDPSKADLKTSFRKYLSEGFCNEHEHFKELRCMDCMVWICAMCAILHHKHCRTLVVEEAYKVMKKEVYQKVEEELGLRNIIVERLSESLRVMEEERKSLIEEIKLKELELKDREMRIEELESLKTEEYKLCDKLKQKKTIVENSSNDAELSKILKELEKLLEEVKKKIPVYLNLPQTRETLGKWLQNEYVYALEDCNDGTRYGKVEVKNGRILVASFQPEKPFKATIFNFSELLSQFNNGCNELPKTVFLQGTFNDGMRDNPFEVIIETDGISPRAKNCIMLCSALKGPSYKGLTISGDSSYYQISSAPSHVVEGIIDDGTRSSVEEGGVYGMWKGNSRFFIQLKDESSGFSSKFGVVIAGLQRMKDLRGRNWSIKECGLVL